MIDAETAQHVADFMHKFLLPHAFAFYNQQYGFLEDNDQLLAVANYILAHQLEEVTNRDMQRGDRSLRGFERQESEKIFERLSSLSWLVSGPRKRFDSPRWIVNPEVHCRFKQQAERDAKRRQQEKQMLSEIFIGGDAHD